MDHGCGRGEQQAIDKILEIGDWFAQVSYRTEIIQFTSSSDSDSGFIHYRIHS